MAKLAEKLPPVGEGAEKPRKRKRKGKGKDLEGQVVKIQKIEEEGEENEQPLIIDDESASEDQVDNVRFRSGRRWKYQTSENREESEASDTDTEQETETVREKVKNGQKDLNLCQLTVLQDSK